MRKTVFNILGAGIVFFAGVIFGILWQRTITLTPANVTPETSAVSATPTPARSQDQVQPTPSVGAMATVSRVIDGDTIELADGSRIRYLGINTPEIKHAGTAEECFAVEAKSANEKLVLGKIVRLERDISETDRYGRLLRYVYVGDVFVNVALVTDGFAYASPYPPDVRYNDELRAAMTAAREQRKGLWGGCPTANAATAPPAPAPDGCIIKGNINAKGEKIFHLPGCGSYTKTFIDETKGERWFCTEAEAATSGFRKAGNCP